MSSAIGLDRIETFRNGRELYPRMLDDINRARTTLCWEMYIFAADPVGELFCNALEQRARAGVEVRLMVDALGSLSTPETLFDGLRRAGGQVRLFNPLSPRLRRARRWRSLPWDRRNHRKLLVIDDRVAYLGGINLGNEFLEWEDLHLRIEGPTAARSAESFLHVWRADPRKLLGSVLARRRGLRRPLQVLDGFPAPDYSPIKRAYLAVIKRSRRRLWISQAYFFPSRRLRKELAKAVARGCDVRVMLPARSDLPIVELASRRRYAGLLRRGVRLFLYDPVMLHAKWACADGRHCIVGSANLDPVGLHRTLEINVLALSPQLGAELECIFEDNLRRCHELDLAGWAQRPLIDKLREWFWYRLRRFFYYG